MKQLFQIMAMTIALTGGWGGGFAHAQYRPPAAKTERVSEEDSFDRSVDLKRFRRGNVEWDTQELIQSGLTALHREHEQILKELASLKAEVARLKEEKK